VVAGAHGRAFDRCSRRGFARETEEPAPPGLGPRAQRGRSHKIATGPMHKMTAPQRAVTVSKDRPNKEFIGPGP